MTQYTIRIWNHQYFLSLFLMLWLNSPNTYANKNYSSLNQGKPKTKTLFTLNTDPFEPTVTLKEQKYLHAAIKHSQENLPEAINMLREKIKDTSSPALDFALGSFYYQNNQLEKSVQSYRNAINKLPNFRNALNWLARVYLLQGKPIKAMEMFQSLVRDGQGNSETLLLLGHCLLVQEKSVQAEGAYRQSLILAPDNPDAMRGLIKSLIIQERYLEVISLTKNLQINFPYEKKMWDLRASAYLSLDQHQEAIECLETARILNAATPMMLITLGYVYLNREQPQDAVSAFREAFTKEKASIEHILLAIQGFLLLEDLEEAARLFQRIDKLALNMPLSTKQQQCYFKHEIRLAILQGRLEQAIAGYESLIREDPLDGESMLSLANLRMESKQFDKSRMLFERASRISGFKTQALVRHAQLEVEQANYKKAILLLENAQVLDDQPHVAHYLSQVRRLLER